MIEQFLSHVKTNKLFSAGSKVLLAVSGGIDSMVMLHLVREAGLKAGVAHVNFQLRGEDSDKDEQLVQRISSAYGLMFYSTHFETRRYAEEKNLSIQMAARELRYTWFDSLCEQHGYDCVATAHHLNDSLETILLNLARGTGIEGMTGIASRKGKLVRPLLFASRQMIEEYADNHFIEWREDVSNASDHYQRNLIRNKVVPLLKQINPALEKGFGNTIERLQGSLSLMRMEMENFRNKAVRVMEEKIMIDKDRLEGMPNGAVVLWELLKEHGFNYGQCKDVLETAHQAGKIFRSSTHQLTVDRNHLLVNRLVGYSDSVREIDIHDICTEYRQWVLELAVLERGEFELTKKNTIAQLDADRLTFPLRWRPWQQGDRFVPLGMQAHKKVSDFLIDEKVSLPDKEAVTIIDSAGEIVWVVGRRIADPYKVTSQTKRILVLRLNSAPKRGL